VATRRNKSVRKAKPAYSHGAIAETADRLERGRGARRRKQGDGKGVDIGIANTFGITLEHHLESVKDPQTRERLHAHIREHVDAAMKPLTKIMKRNGAKQSDIDLFSDIGPNMFRTIIEYFEDKNCDQL
jgi:hypothetical protein